MTEGLLDDAGARALDTPAVVVDLDRIDARIASMAAFMRERGVALRPHAKTHKSIEVARRQIDGRRGRPDRRHDRRGRGLRRRRLRGPVHRLPGDRRRPEGGSAAPAGVAMRRCRSGRIRRRGSRRWRPPMKGATASPRILIEIDSGGARTGVRPELAGSIARHAPRLWLRGGRRVHPRGPRLQGDGAAPGRPATTRSAAWRWPPRRSVPKASSPTVLSAGSTPTAEPVRAWRRHRGATGDVRLRRSTAGRAAPVNRPRTSR